jgi:hypothetical protein
LTKCLRYKAAVPRVNIADLKIGNWQRKIANETRRLEANNLVQNYKTDKEKIRNKIVGEVEIT